MRRLSGMPLVATVLVVVSFGGGSLSGCTSGGRDRASTSTTTAAKSVAPFEVVATRPHDPTAYTEGLAFTEDGRLFESTGRYGESTVRQVDPADGRVIRRSGLDPAYFGEGLTALGDTIIQLTWRESSVLRWDAADLTPGPTSSIEGEGWGLATVDADTLVTSDGGPTLTFRSASDLEPLRSVVVTRDDQPVDHLNELEGVGGAIWANVWRSNEILRIDPTSGKVTAAVDLTSLVPDGLTDPEAVLNGIAHRRGDPASRLWVTGKRWPVLYEIDVAGSLRPR